MRIFQPGDSELDEELRFHVEKQIEANIAAGMNAEEARRQALSLFGGVEAVKEECRDARPVRFLAALGQDARYALRQMRRNPGFTAVALLTLTLCIGANTAIFTVVNAVLLRALPYARADRLVEVQQVRLDRGDAGAVAPRAFAEWRRNLNGLAGIAAFHPFDTFILGGDPPERLAGVRVSPGLFELLGVRPALGRGFSPDEEEPGHERVVVLSYELWKQRFGSDPEVLHRPVVINGASFTVVGVAPRNFHLPLKFELLAPFGPELEAERKGFKYLGVFGRLSPGVALAQAQSRMETVAAEISRQDSKLWTAGIRLLPLKQQIVAPFRPALLVLFAAVAFVLLIGCSNVANLLFARGRARQKEIALRMALGAGRLRLFCQLLTESLVLASVAGCFGYVLSRWGVQLLLALNAGLPRASEVSADGWVLGFNAAISLAAGLIFGCLPAFRASAVNLQGALKDAGGQTRERPIVRNLLVVSEIALSVMLLVGAGLLVRSFWRLQGIDPGFKREGVLAFQVSAPATAGTGAQVRSIYGSADARSGAFFSSVLARVQSIPGVTAAGATNELPFGDRRSTLTFEIEGRPDASSASPAADFRLASPDYFRTMGIPLILGRTLSAQDNGVAGRVALINDYMARTFWPNQNPIGHYLIAGWPSARYQIVGVVGNVKHGGLTADLGPEIYVPWLDRPVPDMYFTISGAGDLPSLVPAIRAAVHEVDKDQPVYGVRTMKQAVARTIADERSNTVMLTIFAGLALLLAAIGIYGVIAYLVEQRRHEIGVRMALGARRSDVLGMLLKQGGVLIVAGLGAGCLGALAASQLLKRMLFGIAPNDWRTFAGAAVLLAAVALLATFIPARRATKVDPMNALRAE